MRILAAIFKEELSDYFYHLTARAFGRVLLIGAVAGALSWVLAVVFDRYLLTPVFCGETVNFTICSSSKVLGAHLAEVLVGVLAVPLLAVNGVRRPLVVVLAAVAALWGVSMWLAGAWWLSFGVSILASLLTYGALTWLTRLRRDAAAFLFIGLFVLLARVVLAL